jgi:hypothetical protein
MLENNKCTLEFKGSEIVGRDKEDTNNLPAFYTQRKRGLKNAWEQIVSTFNEDTSMSEVINVLSERNIRTHYWCMMD